jgi:hypothetical protein
MYKFPVKSLAAMLALVVSNAAFGQTSTYSNPNSENENNPYSKYGIGELWNGNSTALKGMGSISSAYQDPFIVNPDNPASYSWLAATTFQGGLVASYRTITNAAGASYGAGTASIGYLNLGLPIRQKGGLSLGLRPMTHSYYALVDTTVTQIGQTIRSYVGDGGLSYAYAGGSYKVTKDLSVGVNIGYLFGNYRNFTNVTSIDTLVINRAYTAQFANYTHIGGLYWKAGAMYQHTIHDTGLTINIGGTFTLGQDLNESFNNYHVSIYNFGDTIVNDTSMSNTDKKGKLKMPMSFSVGVMLSNTDKWKAGIDFAMSNWSRYTSTADTNMNLGVGTQSYRLSVGGEYTPNSMDLTSYFSRATYRLGLYYGQDYVRLQNTNLPLYGLTLGASFPYKRMGHNTTYFGKVHTSLELGRIGTETGTLLQQTYLRFGLGLTFNARDWFIPKKEL